MRPDSRQGGMPHPSEGSPQQDPKPGGAEEERPVVDLEQFLEEWIEDSEESQRQLEEEHRERIERMGRIGRFMYRLGSTTD